MYPDLTLTIKDYGEGCVMSGLPATAEQTREFLGMDQGPGFKVPTRPPRKWRPVDWLVTGIGIGILIAVVILKGAM